MERFRYGPYRWGPDPLAPPYDLRGAVDELGRDVMEGARPSEALRHLLRRGTGHTAGLDDLVRQVRQRREDVRGRGRLDGTLEKARSMLDHAVGQERAALATDPSDDARVRESGLDSLPSDTSAAVRELARYDWRSSTAWRTFDELRDLLRREVLDSQFRGMKEKLRGGTEQDHERVRAMVDALNVMLAADTRGERTRAGFDRFMAEFGDFFPDAPRTLDALVDSLARRAVATQRLLESLTSEQRAELRGLVEQTTAESGLSEPLRRLSERLWSRRPDLNGFGDPAASMDGPEGLGVGDATTALQELADLAGLESTLEQGYAGANLDDIDEDAIHRLLGRSAVDNLARLRAIERELRDQGYLRGSANRPQLTPKAVRRLGETALRELGGDLAQPGQPGGHPAAGAGTSGEPTGATDTWSYGDERPIDAVRTLGNAVARGQRGPGGRVRIQPADFEVVETERYDAAAVCLLVDVSYSMTTRELWGGAKRTAMALHSLVSTRFPRDAVQIVGFNDYARELTADTLTGLQPEYVQGTNLQHALVLARGHLDRHRGFAPIVLVITDGEPTAHLGRDGTAQFSWPPSPQTTAATLAEVDRMTARGAALSIFMLADDPRLEEFVDHTAERNGGRVLRPDPTRPGAHVIRDYLTRRRRVAS